MSTQTVIESLQALRESYPNLPVTLYTEGMGAAERRVRNRSAALAVCVVFPTAQQDLQVYPLMSIPLLPVVSSSHPLATETRPITRDVLQEHVQLVLTDPLDSSGPSFGVISSRIWRFVDMGSRLDFLLAGSGWAKFPLAHGGSGPEGRTACGTQGSRQQRRGRDGADLRGPSTGAKAAHGRAVVHGRSAKTCPAAWIGGGHR